MSEPRVASGRAARWSHGLAWAALVLVLGGALERAGVAADPMPYWDSDPLLTPSVRTGLGPSAQMLLDMLAMLGGACGLGSAALAGRSVRVWWVALLALGGVWVGVHGWVAPTDPAGTGRGDLEDLIIGGRWLGAMGGAIGLAHLRGRVRRIGLGLCIGFVVMLAAKGVMQRSVEHPLTMHDYEMQREQILGARGWRVDSPQALAYERRLRQNDASGWFGMPNVYATFGGIGLVAGTCLAIGGVRRKQTGATLAAGLGGVCGGAILLMSHSKGGAGAAAIGLGIGVLVGSGWAGERRRVWLLAGAPAVVLLLIVARGVIGERLGELSLLFRWHYAQGSARMILEHPLLGVGPGGFRDAYL
ncbi:MAG: O-antigen ligase family protein, partial [Phycisphaerales bacterium JB059]